MPMGTYQLNVMTFGLQNTPAMFSRLMECDFCEWKEAWAPDQFYPGQPGVEGEEEDEKRTIGVSYMDDFLIGSPNTKQGWRDHSLCTHGLLTRMALKKYYLRPAKCIWMQPTMDLLGMKIEEVSPPLSCARSKEVRCSARAVSQQRGAKSRVRRLL